jgi:hypothetical protein
MEYFIVAAAAVVLVFLVHANLDAGVARRVLPVLLAALAVRLLMHLLVVRTVGYGGDNLVYERRAQAVLAYWAQEGFTFVTGTQIPEINSTAVPSNLFALIMWLCDGTAPLACTAVVGFIACATCIILYRTALLIGASGQAAFALLVLTAFLPSFLVYTSDTFKDGINAFLVIGCVGLALSNAVRFDARKLYTAALLLGALWHVRSYMVFMCALPMALSVVKPTRLLTARTLMIAVIVPLAGLFIGVQAVSGTAESWLASGQSQEALEYNANGGSGIVFDDGGNPWGALVPKLLYTLLSPFPWVSGSVELQLSKLEMLLWYYLLWKAVKGARILWRKDRTMFLILVMFIVPAFVVYATTISNVGLIMRQRIPLVLSTTLLAAVAWSGRDVVAADARRPGGSIRRPVPVPLTPISTRWRMRPTDSATHRRH